MITPFTGMTIVAGFLACSNFYALNRWRKTRKASEWREKRIQQSWGHALSHLCDLRDRAWLDLGQVRADLTKSNARADHYASSWGRVMKLLRIAQKANKELRDAQMRREMADDIDRMAA